MEAEPEDVKDLAMHLGCGKGQFEKHGPCVFYYGPNAREAPRLVEAGLLRPCSSGYELTEAGQVEVVAYLLRGGHDEL